MKKKKININIIGGGLAGSEAANFLANKGYIVNLYEMRPNKSTGAHNTDKLGELVCSNSLKSKSLDNACGLLKEEIKTLDSLMMEAALNSEVPSGNALGVDRDLFADYITNKILNNPNINVIHDEITSLPDGYTIICTGPLTSDGLINEIKNITNNDVFHFFDASAPIIKLDSIDMNIAYKKSRYDQEDNSYINCPFTRDEYYDFIKILTTAEIAPIHEFDTNYFEGCMPIEVMAKRGIDTLRFGPLKPKGLEKSDGYRPFAVVQLRQDNVIGDLYNIVGFQTNLLYKEQKRVFSMIPGLKNAEFIRYGLMHRNTYINAPICLNNDLSLKINSNIYIAGQLSGVEGYVESAATGLYAAMELYKKLEEKSLDFPKDTMLYGLINYITNANPKDFSPMNANYGIIYGITKTNRLEFADKSITKLKDYKTKL